MVVGAQAGLCARKGVHSVDWTMDVQLAQRAIWRQKCFRTVSIARPGWCNILLTETSEGCEVDEWQDGVCVCYPFVGPNAQEEKDCGSLKDFILDKILYCKICRHLASQLKCIFASNKYMSVARLLSVPFQCQTDLLGSLWS